MSLLCVFGVLSHAFESQGIPEIPPHPAQTAQQVIVTLHGCYIHTVNDKGVNVRADKIAA